MTFDEADTAYPYDPAARSERLSGLEKLRAFREPSMRRAVYELWVNVQRRREAPRQAAIDWTQSPRRECLEPQATEDWRDR